MHGIVKNTEDNLDTAILTNIRKALKQNSDEKVRESFKRFFRESVRFYGVKSAVVAKIAREHFSEIKNSDKKTKFALIGELLKAGYFEESMIAYTWAEKISKSFDEQDFSVLETWLSKYVSNWAECDTLCNHAIGSFIDRYPAFVKNLKTWAKSKNRWVRRGAAVTLILPARRGKFLADVFEIADILLLDNDDLVQKGYGWMLKEASKEHQKEVFDYIMKNKKVMPRTALRYALEKMPDEMRRKAMGR
jgi:3-methyladenine DNA glycosylase AlkD